MDGVKKRRLEDAQAQLANRRRKVQKSRVRTSSALANPLTGGFLRRELGLFDRLQSEDEALECWTRGLRAKGCVDFGMALGSFVPMFSDYNLPLVCVTNHEAQKGFGHFYTCEGGASARLRKPG